MRSTIHCQAPLNRVRFKGTYYVVIFYGAAMGLRLLSSVILSRLFLPEYFGLMALVTTVIVGMNLFSHVGLQDSVIQNPRETSRFLNTAWTIQVIRGAGLFLFSYSNSLAGCPLLSRAGDRLPIARPWALAA